MIQSLSWVDNTLLMQTEPSIHQYRKTVHDPWKYRLLKLPLFNSLKPVMIEFCTNRRHTRTCTFLAGWAILAYP